MEKYKFAIGDTVFVYCKTYSSEKLLQGKTFIIKLDKTTIGTLSYCIPLYVKFYWCWYEEDLRPCRMVLTEKQNKIWK